MIRRSLHSLVIRDTVKLHWPSILGHQCTLHPPSPHITHFIPKCGFNLYLRRKPTASCHMHSHMLWCINAESKKTNLARAPDRMGYGLICIGIVVISMPVLRSLNYWPALDMRVRVQLAIQITYGDSLNNFNVQCSHSHHQYRPAMSM